MSLAGQKQLTGAIFIFDGDDALKGVFAKSISALQAKGGTVSENRKSGSSLSIGFNEGVSVETAMDAIMKATADEASLTTLAQRKVGFTILNNTLVYKASA